MPSRRSKKIELNGTHQLLVYVDDVNIGRKRVSTINKNVETVLVTSKEDGLEVDTETAKNLFMSRHHDAGQIDSLMIANKSSTKCGKHRNI
jgi:hypothetical protein